MALTIRRDFDNNLKKEGAVNGRGGSVGGIWVSVPCDPLRELSNVET